MASAPAKKTVGDVTAFFFIGMAVLMDGIKFLLLFVDAIPFVGIPISFLGSWMISLFEVLFIFFPLYLAGAYRGKSSTTNALLTMAAGVIDFVPILDDLPATTAAVVTVIVRSRISDKAEELENIGKKAAQEKKTKEQQVRSENAEAAAERAATMRQQAMTTSLRAANDNERLNEPLSEAA